MYLECFEYRKDGGLHVGVRIGVGAGSEQVLERVSQCRGDQVETVDNGQRLQQKQRIAPLAVSLEHDD